MKEMPNNELDMDAYHSEGIDPGDHKTFNISSTIHSFNERFAGDGITKTEGWQTNPTFDQRYRGELQPQYDTFDQRFQGVGDFPSAPIHLWDTTEWWKTDIPKQYPGWRPGSKIGRQPPTNPDQYLYFPGGGSRISKYRGPDLQNVPLTDETGIGTYQLISDDRQVPFAPYSAKSIEDIADKHQVEGSKLKEMLDDLAHHPENFIGPGELGATVPKGFRFLMGAPLGNKNNLVYEVLDNPEIVGKLINDYKEGNKTLDELASELNVSRNAVIYRLNKAGVLGSKIDPETINKRDRDLLDKFNSGMSFGDIAKELGVSRNSIAGKINRLKQRLGNTPVRDKTNTSPTLPKLNLPEFENYSDPEYEKALSDWMKNQFEGGPSEREFRGMSSKDFNKFNEFTQRRMQTHVANDNKNLDLGTGGFDKENGGILGNIEKATPEKEMPRSQQEEHKYRKALGDQILKRNPPDENFTSDQWKKIAEKEGHVLEHTSRKRPNPYLAARRHSEGGKTTVIVSERFSGENKRTVFHNGEKIHSDWSPSEDPL